MTRISNMSLDNVKKNPLLRPCCRGWIRPTAAGSLCPGSGLFRHRLLVRGVPKSIGYTPTEMIFISKLRSKDQPIPILFQTNMQNNIDQRLFFSQIIEQWIKNYQFEPTPTMKHCKIPGHRLEFYNWLWLSRDV